MYNYAMRSLRNFYLPLILFLIVILAYWNLPKTFFQQDEWLSFGKMIFYETTGGVGNVLLVPFLFGKGHFTPLSYYQLYLEFKLFGLSFEPYVYVSIVTHIVNSLLLFYFVYLLLKNKFLAFCSALFFAVESISSQAVTWIGASPNTQGTVLFLLLSLIFIFKYLQNNQKRSYYIALVFFFVGLLFKETILFFFILVLLMWILFGQKKSRKNFVSFLKPLIILGFIYVLIRASLFFVSLANIVPSSKFLNQPFTFDIIRLILLPFKILPQSMFSQHYLIGLSDMATLFFYPQQAFGEIVNPYFSQTVVFGQVIPFLSIPILLIGFIAYKLLLKRKEVVFSRIIIFSLAFIMLSSLPLAFILGDAGSLPIYESRHFHMAAIGVGIFLVVGLYAVVNFFLKQSKYVYPILFVILAPILLMHLMLTRTEIDRLVRISIPRESILKSIITSYPKLPQKAVFYTESDTAYYGMPIEEKMLPVQIGFGSMLLVWYQKNEKFPSCLFDFDVQAYDMRYQGYKECSGRGFGYFRDYDKLVVAIKENNISANDIIAYSWKGKTEELKDITEQIRSKIKRDITYGAAK